MGADAPTSRWGFRWFSVTTQLLLLVFLTGHTECWRPANGPAAGPTSTNIPNAGWMHRMRLDANYDVYWSINESEVTFEVQVRTLGYLVFGLSPSGHFHDADLIVGWVHNGRPRFQDRHGLANGGSSLDPQQDYDLIGAHENETHTVMRFRRKLVTCDDKDLNITVSTSWMMYAYSASDPLSDADISFSSNPHGSKPVYLMHRSQFADDELPADVKVWDLRNYQVSVPENEDTLHWCRIFKLPPLDRKHHMIRYEPVFTAGSQPFVHHMNVYECVGDPSVFEVLAATEGSRCYQPSMPPLFFNCNNVVVAWTAGSEGFTFPSEAGYPMNRAGGAKFFMLETHYDNPNLQSGIVDHSGLRLFYTSQLRHHDAGVLSVGIDPNWKHIVPPGQRRVVSEAHCVADCTQQALPSRGINVFAVNQHTHLLGRQVQLRHIRGDKELPALVDDANYDVHYQEYRQFQKPVNVLPGDHLISQCTYNSESRSTITLGGLSTREETCLAYLLYWPRVDLSLCYSLPSLATILHSLGIQELHPGSDPVRIKSPPELADQTVEERLITFDWDKNFHTFQEATRRGAFRPLCWGKTQALIDGSTAPDYYAPNVTQPLPEADPAVCAPRGTLPPRPATVAKTPHRKNVNGGAAGQSAVQRNRTVTTTTNAPVTVPAVSTTTTGSRVASITAGRPSLSPESNGQVNSGGQVASVWGQGASLNHEKVGPAPSSVVIETPLNDVLHLHNHTAAATQETTASQELSSRRASVMHNSSTAPPLASSFTIILIALCCTYNSVWASVSCSSRSL
ncbi:hypothetical protein GHT06_013617 [Daphnia sinensis]|uniref:DOMON domain-containing protein n=1 Tax=Daphnia sinensis TaxID=1820382 RepID=A0AAD5KV14_9CRUS|nr:hypothetical protein GHT06_013617 [Daphnia sinensis]